jgi:hypothetical protein
LTVVFFRMAALMICQPKWSLPINSWDQGSSDPFKI